MYLKSESAVKKRLALIANIFEPGSIKLLVPLLQKNHNVLELGTGIGAMLPHIAPKVHSVTAVDISQEQLDLAKTKMTQTNITNVEFICKDVADIGTLTGEYDIIYSRLLLMHLADPVLVINQLKELLTPNGRIILEEPDATTFSCRPENSLFTTWDTTCIKMLSKPKFGITLAQLMKEAGFTIETTTSTPVLRTEVEKSFPRLCFEEMEIALFEARLISPKTFDAVCKELKLIEGKPDTEIDMMTMHQYQCRR